VANHKSAEKRNRQRPKRRARNVFRLSTMRTYMKRVRKALGAGDLAAAKEAMPLALTAIARAAAKGAIHRNTASRYVSRLTLALNRAVAIGA
jgi:small subunit ribosomal protein S20